MLKYFFLILFSVFALFAAVMVINPWLLVDASASGYGTSLGEAFSGGAGDCGGSSYPELLVCGVETDPGSGPGARFVLRPEGDHCWSAIQLSGRKSKTARPEWVPKAIKVDGKTFHGCVNLGQEILPSTFSG